jgi:hypothetical protein
MKTLFLLLTLNLSHGCERPWCARSSNNNLEVMSHGGKQYSFNVSPQFNPTGRHQRTNLSSGVEGHASEIPTRQTGSSAPCLAREGGGGTSSEPLNTSYQRWAITGALSNDQWAASRNQARAAQFTFRITLEGLRNEYPKDQCLAEVRK